jgi:cytochrome c oxidase cbb3-type subunit 4
MSATDIEQIRAYMYVIGTGVVVFLFYYYIVYIYRSEKKGIKDYEKYGKLALDDELDSKPLEINPKLDKEKKE